MFERIILDTNALISPFQFGYNLDMELARTVPWATPVIPTSVIVELERLSREGNWMARAGARLAEKYEKVTVRGKGDASIISLATSRRWMVMTQDRKLRSILNGRGIPVVMVRDKGHLHLVEP